MGSKTIRNIQKIFKATSGVLFGRKTTGTGRGEELTPSDVRTMLSVSTTSETATLLAAKADLVGGLVPAGQLPSYVDDVVEAANLAAFPVTGEAGKIYVALDTSRTYRWSGSAYVELTDSTAVWGSVSGTLSNQTDLQSALDAKQATLVSGTNLKTVNGSTLLGSGDLSVAGGSGGIIHQRPYSSDSGSYCGDDVISAAATLALVANRKYLIPQRFSNDCTISEVAMGVTAAVVGTNIRIGLRALNQSTGIPGALIADFGTVSSASTGLKQITSLSQAVTAGIHCWEIVSDGAPTLRGASNGTTLPLLGFSVATTTFNVVAFLFRAFTYATLPSDESLQTQTVQSGVARPSVMFKAS
jgi:hypothetical protein